VSGQEEKNGKKKKNNCASDDSGNGDDGREGLAATVAGESRRPVA